MTQLSHAPVAFVDDDPDLRLAAQQSLALAGFEPRLFASGEEALDGIDAEFPGVVVTDIRMPGLSGIELFRTLARRDPDLPVILVTGHGDIDMAVATLREGAYDFIPKPYAGERLIESIGRALEKRQLVLENRRLKALAETPSADSPLIGETASMQRLRATLRQIAGTDVDVLVLGETGSGKEVVADLLHRWSGRVSRPFVALNCGALPETVIESELFGHEAGAFTGATKRRVGRIEHSGGGTLFLDEIESMPLALQVKLLRVLETRSVQPLGTNENRPVDLRVVAATKTDLGASDARAHFREDLYYRLNVVTVRIPPLRERREDVPLLFAHFLRRAAERFGRDAPPINAATARRLSTHDWPGNVRELSHFAERVALGLEPETAEPFDAGSDEALTLPQRMERFEAEVIRETLQAKGGDVRATLDALGIPRKTFYDKLARHGIDRARFVRQE